MRRALLLGWHGLLQVKYDLKFAVSFMCALIDDLRVWAMLAYYAMCCHCYLVNSAPIIVLCMYCACCDRHLLLSVSYMNPWCVYSLLHTNLYGQAPQFQEL